MIFPWFSKDADASPGGFYAILTFYALSGLWFAAIGAGELFAAVD